MNNIFRKLFFCTLSFIFTVSLNVSAQNNIYINDNLSNIQYIYDGDVRMIPVRETAEALGYNVFWNDINSSVSIAKTEYCLNQNGVHDFVFFCINTPGITMWDSDTNKFDSIDTTNHTACITDGITYISPYYFCRALDIMLKNFTEDETIYIYTRDYLNS